MLSIDEIKKQLFIDSEDVCGNTMVDIYEAEESCDMAYNRAVDDFKEKINELEKSYKEKYGCEIVEMYSEIVSDLKGWIAEQLK